MFTFGFYSDIINYCCVEKILYNRALGSTSDRVAGRSMCAMLTFVQQSIAARKCFVPVVEYYRGSVSIGLTRVSNEQGSVLR